MYKDLCFLSFQAEAEEKAVSTKEVLMKWRVDLGEEGAGKCTDHRAGRKGNRTLALSFLRTSAQLPFVPFDSIKELNER